MRALMTHIRVKVKFLLEMLNSCNRKNRHTHSSQSPEQMSAYLEEMRDELTCVSDFFPLLLARLLRLLLSRNDGQ